MEIKLTMPWGHIAAKTYGPSTGKPVLMVHGRSDNAGSYTRLMKYLPMNHYYVCVDLPGHGWSSHFPSWQTIDFLDYVNTIHFILKALKWETCIYIGHSMGAQLGVVFSVIQPQRFTKIIALEGFAPLIPIGNDFLTSLKDMYTLSIKASGNVKPLLYTKEEVLYALRYMRFATLNSDAAEALFERGVTEVNGKYKYNRDIRLKRLIFSLLNPNQLIQIAREVTVPVYLFVASNGVSNLYNHVFHSLDSMNPQTLLEIIPMYGNHDIHNNNPERVAPFICKILNGNTHISSNL